MQAGSRMIGFFFFVKLEEEAHGSLRVRTQGSEASESTVETGKSAGPRRTLHLPLLPLFFPTK